MFSNNVFFLVVMAINRHHDQRDAAAAPGSDSPSPKAPETLGIAAGEYHQIKNISNKYNSVIAERRAKTKKENETGLPVAGWDRHHLFRNGTAITFSEQMPNNVDIGTGIGAPSKSQYREDDKNFYKITDEQNLQNYKNRAYPEVKMLLSLTQPVTYYESAYSGMVNSQEFVRGVTRGRGKRAKREVMLVHAKELGPEEAQAVYDVMVSWNLHKAESTKTLNVVFEKASGETSTS